jgi:hypothetical protein
VSDVASYARLAIKGSVESAASIEEYTRYRTLSPEQKAEHKKRCLAWRKANPERWEEIQSRAHKRRL